MNKYYSFLLALMVCLVSTATTAIEATITTSQAPQSESKVPVAEEEPDCD